MALKHLPENAREEARAWNLQLGVPGFKFADLNRVRRLEALDAAFFRYLTDQDAELATELERYRAVRGEGWERLVESTLLMRLAPHVGTFVARLLRIEAEYEALCAQVRDDHVVFDWKRQFIERRILKRPPAAEAVAALDPVDLEFAYREVVNAVVPNVALMSDPERELAVVTTTVQAALDSAPDEAQRDTARAQLGAVEAWTSVLAFHPALAQRRKQFTCFHVPQKLDHDELVPRVWPRPDLPEYFMGPPAHHRLRDGFDLTDPRYTQRENLRESHYCVTCHERAKDSCSTGLLGKDGVAQRNPLGIALHGCPLDEKISEMIALYRDGHPIGALAVIMIDNPMLAGTGHRICNDCMKSCIFQKQDPVNIPQIETGILTEVLRLPYGFEIVSLLTRWNPLNVQRPYPLRYNGKNVLVVGMGPAGYTLAHHLLNEGFGVVGIEGLKVEPLAPQLRGAKRRVPRPIRDIGEIVGPLSQRPTLGFGGVAEYGITVRWDKNFLDINYVLLMRRKKFRLLDGVRFGGTIGIDDAWRLGFDHIAIAAGAGRPTIVPMHNNLARGVRMASDFLMALQGQGAYRKNSLTNLQIELPAIVIGGGLTAIDTATELQAYYIIQVEKALERYERLRQRIGEAAVWARLDAEETQTVRTWLDHGRMVQAERAAARAAGRQPDFARLVRGWGGVTIAYRKRLQDSPAYRLNHEEVIKSLEEGIGFIECMSPTEAVLDAHNHVQAVRCTRMTLVDGKWKDSGEVVDLPARAVMVAAGTNPNVVYEREHPGTFALDEKHACFAMHRVVDAGDGGTRRLEAVADGGVGFFTSYEKDGRYVTFYGDAHPVFAGNVVKAMASAQRGYPEIARLFEREVAAQEIEEQAERENAWVRFAEVLDVGLRASVVDAIRLADRIVEVIVRAPLATRNFRPGQFYRVQNYEGSAEVVDGIRLTMEGVALTGAWTDPARGLISLIVLEMGGSSRLCAMLEPGEEVVLMGPTGTATDIPEGETVLLAGGGLGNAVMFSIAAAMKARGNRVVYFAGYKRAGDLFKRRYIEDACDLVVWSVDEGEPIVARRAQDRSVVGNIVQAVQRYAGGELGDTPIALRDVDRLICIGSDRMMDAVRAARHGVLRDVLGEHVAIGSINSPMQCMLKEVCSQCLQRHVDPATGRETLVFSCFDQDQPLDRVDFQFLHQRLRQNSAAEKLTSLWLDHLFEQREVQVV